MKRKILKKAMSKSYCGATRFDYLDDEEITMIYKAMEDYYQQKTEQIKTTKNEKRDKI